MDRVRWPSLDCGKKLWNNNVTLFICNIWSSEKKRGSNLCCHKALKQVKTLGRCLGKFYTFLWLVACCHGDQWMYLSIFHETNRAILMSKHFYSDMGTCQSTEGCNIVYVIIIRQNDTLIKFQSILTSVSLKHKTHNVTIGFLALGIVLCFGIFCLFFKWDKCVIYSVFPYCSSSQ